MVVSNQPWGKFTEADYTPEQFCNACLLDFNPSGEQKVKRLCFLPYKEPDGTVNRHGVQATAGGRGLTRVQQPQGVNRQDFVSARKKAANKIISLYKSVLERDAPTSVFRIAGKRQK